MFASVCVLAIVSVVVAVVNVRSAKYAALTTTNS